MKAALIVVSIYTVVLVAFYVICRNGADHYDD